jgi:hypothetical protein
MDVESILKDASAKIRAMQQKKISFRGAEATGLFWDLQRFLGIRFSRQLLAEHLLQVPAVTNEILCERAEQRGGMTGETLCDGTKRLDRKLHAYISMDCLTYGNAMQDHGVLGIRLLDDDSQSSRDLFIITFQECLVMGRVIDGNVTLRVTSRSTDNCKVEQRASRLAAQLVSSRAGGLVSEFDLMGKLQAEVPPPPTFDGTLFSTVVPPRNLLSLFEESFLVDSDSPLPVPFVEPISADHRGIGPVLRNWTIPAIRGRAANGRVLIQPDIFVPVGDAAHWMMLAEAIFYDHVLDVKQMRKKVLAERERRLAEGPGSRAAGWDQAGRFSMRRVASGVEGVVSGRS